MRNALLAFVWASALGAAPAPAALEQVRRDLADGTAGTAAFDQPQVWTTQSGLPHNSIHALLQARDGYLWLATPAGLARFDGTRFTRFDHSNVPVMLSDDCTSLSEGADGTLWIGTAKGLLRLRNGVFTLLTQKDGLLDDQVWAVCARRAGGVWVSSRDGVVRWDRGRADEFHFHDPVSRSETALLEDTSGTLWLDRRANVARVSPTGQMETKPFKVPTSSRFFYQNRKGVLWWTDGASLLRWHSGAERIETVWSRPEDRQRISAITEDADGAIWFGFHGNGVYRLVDGRIENINTSHGLSDNLVTALGVDHEGSLWIGTERGGLNRLRRRSLATLGVNEGLAHENTWAICEARDGSVWIGTDDGLSRWSGGRCTNFSEANGLSKNTVRALCEDRAGDLWIGTGDGLNRFRDGRFTRVSLGDGAGANKVRVIYEDRAGHLWVGTAVGLYRRTDAEFLRFGDESEIDIRAMHEDRSGRIWMATYGGGLIRIDGGTRTDFTAEQGLSSNFVLGIFEDEEGVLWIATERGLNRLKDDRLFAYSLRHGLFDEALNFLLNDGAGHFWLSTDDGIYRASRKDLNDVAEGRARNVTFAHYGVADGMASAETNGQKSQPAGCRTRDGKLWFPTTQGVVIIDPNRLAREEPPPPVLVEEMRADGETLFANVWTEGASPPARGPAARDSAFRTPHSAIKLPPGRGRVLEFHYTANSFVGADKVRFKYRLEGYDEHWIDAGARRVAFYTNLRPRSYRFRVIACNSHGVWNETGASLAFALAPHFYQTWSFYAASVLALLAGGYGLHRWAGRRQRALHSLQQQLSLERERARIARDMHDSLGASLTQIALLSEQSKPHADDQSAAAPGEGVVAAKAREAIRDLNELVWAVNPRNDTLEQFADFLCQHVENFFAGTPIRVRLDLPSALAPLPISADVRHHLAAVFKEALNNVARHARATQVRVSLQVQEDFLTLRVEDDGRGFDPQSAASARATPASGGNGLLNMKQRVEHVGGQFILESQPGAGTRVTVRVPLL